MTDKAVSQTFGDAFLQRLDVGVYELDHGTCVHVDQVVVVVAFGVFIARATVSEFQPVQNARLFK